MAHHCCISSLSMNFVVFFSQKGSFPFLFLLPASPAVLSISPCQNPSPHSVVDGRHVFLSLLSFWGGKFNRNLQHAQPSQWKVVLGPVNQAPGILCSCQAHRESGTSRTWYMDGGALRTVLVSTSQKGQSPKHTDLCHPLWGQS